MYTFKKEERLCSQKLLDKLFHKGSSFLLYPFRIIWINEAAQSVPAQVVMQVSKKRFKRAVDRNLIKRRIREIYRLNKQELLYSHLSPNQTLLLGISYIGKDIPDYSFLEPKLKKAMAQLQTEYLAMQKGTSE